jgi:hypothetical protein
MGEAGKKNSKRQTSNRFFLHAGLHLDVGAFRKPLAFARASAMI